MVEDIETLSSSSVEEPQFICGCHFMHRSACNGNPFYKKDHEGREYCVLHYPGTEKTDDFRTVLEQKIASQDFDFQGIWFPYQIDFSQFEFKKSVDFAGANFSAHVNFYSATFAALARFRYARFGDDARFDHADFGAADFHGVTFVEDVRFESAKFRGNPDFSAVSFKGDVGFNYASFHGDVSFQSANFGGDARFDSGTFSGIARFNAARFGGNAIFEHGTFNSDALFALVIFCRTVSFSSASFKDHFELVGGSDGALFGDGASLSLLNPRIEKPDRVLFASTTLRPHWFVASDPRKFEFVDVEMSAKETRRELKALSGRVSSKHSHLSIACRRLALNAEENHRYEEASNLRYMSMEAQRLSRPRRWALLRLIFWYWLASGYGERIYRAFGGLVLIVALSALLYTKVGFVRELPARAASLTAVADDRVGAPLDLRDAFFYSLGVVSFQKPEPKPLTTWARSIVMWETVFGPVQAALFLLAVRRKFMK